MFGKSVNSLFHIHSAIHKTPLLILEETRHFDCALGERVGKHCIKFFLISSFKFDDQSVNDLPKSVPVLFKVILMFQSPDQQLFKPFVNVA